MLEKYQNVTVTGGLGFIGTHLVGELQSLGKNVTIIDSLWTSADKLVPKGVRFIEADIRDPGKIAESIEGADLVFHVAANSTPYRFPSSPGTSFPERVQDVKSPVSKPQLAARFGLAPQMLPRSEERRVGKEGRSRWSAD